MAGRGRKGRRERAEKWDRRGMGKERSARRRRVSMGSWERVCDTASLVYAKWVQRARGEGRGKSSERRRGLALGVRVWTGWQVALGLIMALGPGRRRRDDEEGAGEGVS